MSNSTETQKPREGWNEAFQNYAQDPDPLVFPDFNSEELDQEDEE